MAHQLINRIRQSPWRTPAAVCDTKPHFLVFYNTMPMNESLYRLVMDEIMNPSCLTLARTDTTNIDEAELICGDSLVLLITVQRFFTTSVFDRSLPKNLPALILYYADHHELFVATPSTCCAGSTTTARE